MNNLQLQVSLTAVFGDGTFVKKGRMANFRLKFSSVNRDYMVYKKLLLADMCTANVLCRPHNQGSFKQSNCKPIYTIETRCRPELITLYDNHITDNLNLLDETGVALWFYDDGSFHKWKHFYNLNTHYFSKEVQEDAFIPYFKSIGIEVRLRPDRKKSGQEYWYLYVPAKDSKQISIWMSRHDIPSLKHKVYSSETIPQGSRVQENSKNVTCGITTEKI